MVANQTISDIFSNGLNQKQKQNKKPKAFWTLTGERQSTRKRHIFKKDIYHKILIFGFVITGFESSPVLLLLTVMPRPQVFLKPKKIASI